MKRYGKVVEIVTGKLRLHIFVLLATLIVSCARNTESADSQNTSDCVTIELPSSFTSSNNYQMVNFGNIMEYIDSDSCFRLNDWVNQELYYFESKDDFLDTLYAVDGIPSVGDSIYEANEYLRLFKYNFAFGSGVITMVDCINLGDKWQISRFDVQFDRSCNLPMVSTGDNLEFTSSCFKLVSRDTKNVPTDKWNEVREAIIETDFMNIAYFDTGEVTLCDGYDIQIIYDGKSSVITDQREFYRSCPGALSPIGIVSEKVLGL